MTHINRFLIPTFACLILFFFTTQVQAQNPLNKRLSEHSGYSVADFVEQYCLRCHGSQTQTAGIDLAALLEQHPLVRNRDTWSRVIETLGVGKMPPVTAPQPTDTERSELVAALSDAIDNFDYSAIDDPGFEPLRRLTHRELQNTLRDLIAVDFPVTDRFPTELTGSSGFDNSANTLFLESTLMERYIVAAERVIELMLPKEPTSEAQRRAHEMIFVVKPGNGLSNRQAADQILRRFLERAYRRPSTTEDIERALTQFDATLRSSDSFTDAIKVALQAILISPKFLLRVEAAQDTKKPYAINDWDLASRLSYFLWASMPDAQLRARANDSTLSDPETLAAEVDRMLRDPRADALGNIFAGQWLGFQHVGTRIWLDPIDNPWVTDTLMTAMRQETSSFFMSLIRENEPIHLLIDADYTYVNEELASTLYDRQDIVGNEMRRVLVTDRNRGGILGHGSILALTSNYKETSPVKRGHYVLDTILGTPPPPPPPNAGVLSEEVADLEKLSFREKVELHSSNPTCRACHSRIDPIGFGLENFDYFGRWRESYHFRERVETEEEADEIRVVEDTNVFNERRYYKNIYTPISAKGTLPNGTPFAGPAELKQVLLEERHDDLVRQIVSKMLSYALGRQLEYYDEPAVRTIIKHLEANDYGFQTLIKSVVDSYPFRYKKAPSVVPN